MAAGNTAVGATDSRRTCHAQWEDQRIRYGREVRGDESISAELRLDYRVSDNLKVFVSAHPTTGANTARHFYP